MKRLKRLNEAPETKHQSFWCKYCKKDFEGVGYKCPIPSNVPEAVYRIRHRCGTVCIRRITEFYLDPYFHLSRRLWMERNKCAVDTLQRHSHGYRTYYGDILDKQDDEEFEREMEKIKKNYDPSLRLLT